MKKNAFSILELAIVLIIIGLLTAGVVKGGAMIKSSRLAGARAITSSSEIVKLDGLLAWYETSILQSIAAEQTTDGASVGAWADISPGSFSLQRNILTRTPSNAVTYAADGINNIPSIRFNGGRFELGELYQGPTLQATIFMVFRPEGQLGSSNFTLFDAASDKDDFLISLSNSNILLKAGNSSTFTYSIQAGENYIVAAHFNLGASAAYLNDAANMNDGFGDIGANQLNGISIGTDKSGNAGFTGLISEVIIYNRSLKLNERKDVMRYLAKKYKINVGGI